MTLMAVIPYHPQIGSAQVPGEVPIHSMGQSEQRLVSEGSLLFHLYFCFLINLFSVQVPSDTSLEKRAHPSVQGKVSTAIQMPYCSSLLPAPNPTARFVLRVMAERQNLRFHCCYGENGLEFLNSYLVKGYLSN